MRKSLVALVLVLIMLTVGCVGSQNVDRPTVTPVPSLSNDELIYNNYLKEKNILDNALLDAADQIRLEPGASMPNSLKQWLNETRFKLLWAGVLYFDFENASLAYENTMNHQSIEYINTKNLRLDYYAAIKDAINMYNNKAAAFNNLYGKEYGKADYMPNI